MRNIGLLRIGLLLGWMPCLVSVAAAQALVDPTRPPGGQSDAVAGGEPAGGPVLQVVMLSPHRKAAVISGEAVLLGGRYGAARLVRLTESEAVLKNGDEITVLRLYPRAEKRLIGRPESGGSGQKRDQKAK